MCKERFTLVSALQQVKGKFIAEKGSRSEPRFQSIRNRGGLRSINFFNNLNAKVSGNSRLFPSLSVKGFASMNKGFSNNNESVISPSEENAAPKEDELLDEIDDILSFYSEKKESNIKETQSKQNTKPINSIGSHSNNDLNTINNSQESYRSKQKKFLENLFSFKQPISEQSRTNEIIEEKEEALKDDPAPLNYDRNFKSLVLDTYQGVKYLNKTFNKNTINTLTEIFVDNIIKTKDTQTNEQNTLHQLEKYFTKTFTSKNQNSSSSTQAFNNKAPVLSTKQKQELHTMSNRTFRSLVIVYEFLDRGMRGFLTGDITLTLITNLESIIESKLKELEKHEQNFTALGMNTNDFYEAFFKIDPLFFKNNTSKSLVVNLASHLESEGIYKKKVMYYVNLKHTQLCNNYHVKFQLMHYNKDITMDEVKKEINNTKNYVQQVFNDLYNEILDLCVFTKLKTPYNGLRYPHYENQSNLFRRQVLIEEGSFENANEDFMKLFSSLQNIDQAHELFFNKKLLLNWHENLVFAVAEAQKSIIQKQEFLKKTFEYLKYIITLKAEEISMVCLLYLIKVIINNLMIKKDDSDEQFLKVLRNDSEPNLEEEFELSIPLVNFSDDLGSLFFSELRNTRVSNSFDSQRAKLYYKHLSLNMMQFEVDKRDKIKIGLFLANLMTRNLSFLGQYEEDTEKQSKILKIVQKQIDSFKTQNYVTVDKEFMIKYYNDLQKTFSQTIQIKRSLPMIYPPMPWKCAQIGSYYLRQTSFSKIFSENVEGRNCYDSANMLPVMRTLDHLSNIGWRINAQVLDLIEYIWANGGGKATIPMRFNEKLITSDDIKSKPFKEKVALLRESQSYRELHSLRCDFMIKYQIAKDFSKVKEFYFPHNIDYRGRTYPISPHLNHIGNDFCRGLLEYSEGKALGKSGLKWMKVHLANVIGKDKLPLKDRELYVDSIMDVVKRCAENPYNNTEWQDTDNPWQVISAMIEVNNAIKSGDPSKYKTNLHCHVDGSCNGLQHYSALSKDYHGGFEVNLINRDKPGDVYSKVLDIVLEKIRTESNPADVKYAKLLKESNCVNRKVVKQTVMTSVYGVTLIGARDQIKRQLADKKLFDPNTLFSISMYLAKKTIESIGDLFREANQIKSWLTKCALVISHSGNCVKWVTPLGLPCIQPYRRLTNSELIKTHTQGVKIMTDFDNQPVNKRKQGTAFPPNYIHSLDSTHMMMSCNRAIDSGISFSSVHDSYWCHPSDIDQLNQILREEFVNLYSQPLLENLLEGFHQCYPELKFPEIPETGTLNLEEVRDSTYFFS